MEQNQEPVRSQPVTGRTRDVVLFADRVIFKLATHWLFLANLFWGLYVGLPLLAPLLMNAGLATPAQIIYLVYRPACHQRPERSYFVGGPEVIYTPEELAAAGVDPASRDIGNEQVGWKVAFCERDVAIYGTIFLAGLVYGAVRHRIKKGWKLRLRYFILFAVPMFLDGVIQLFTGYESNWLLRSITGAIFGLGVVVFAYPYLEEGFAEVRATSGATLARAKQQDQPPG